MPIAPVMPPPTPLRPVRPIALPIPAVPAPKAPGPAACEPVAIGAAPIALPCIGAAPARPVPIGANDDRKPSAKSRSMPGWNSRPANRARKPRRRGAAIRSSMCSTTWSAVARPMRAKSAAGIRSAFSIVPVVSPSVTTAPDAFDNVSVSVSSPSSYASSSTATSTVPDVSPAWNESVPLAAV